MGPHLTSFQAVCQPDIIPEILSGNRLGILHFAWQTIWHLSYLVPSWRVVRGLLQSRVVKNHKSHAIGLRFSSFNLYWTVDVQTVTGGNWQSCTLPKHVLGGEALVSWKPKILAKHLKYPEMMIIQMYSDNSNLEFVQEMQNTALEWT